MIHETLGLSDLSIESEQSWEREIPALQAAEQRRGEKSIPSSANRAEPVSLPWPKGHRLTSLLILIFCLSVCILKVKVFI